MDTTPLSLVELIRNISLALFAISTWYIGHEEKRARMLFNISITVEDRLMLNLAEVIIALRDKYGLDKSFGEQIDKRSLVRLHEKLDKLKKLDFLRALSVLVFALFVAIEIWMVASSWLTSLLN